MSHLLSSLLVFFSIPLLTAHAQQQCYYGAGAENRGPASLVPCLNTGQSACCLLGDVCLSGNACWNWATGNTYQYGCTDITYQDESCPYKCGFNSSLSPWTAIEYCKDPPGVHDTWVCHAPESCGCEWDFSEEMLQLQPRGCEDMGSDARVALKGPTELPPYVSLPASYDGTTAYFSGTTINGTSTWVETAVSGYTPSPVTQLTTLEPQPTEAILINAEAKPSPSTVGAAVSTTASTTPNASGTDSTTAAAYSPASTSAPQGLSTGAKVGIGVGIGGAALLIISATLAILLFRNRRSKTKAANQNAHPYPIGAPMQASPYFAQPEKNPWQTGKYSVGSSPPLMSPQFEQMYQQHQYAHMVPSLYSEQRSAKPPDVSPPTELSTGHEFHELQTDRVVGESEFGSPLGTGEAKPKSSSF